MLALNFFKRYNIISCIAINNINSPKLENSELISFNDYIS